MKLTKYYSSNPAFEFLVYAKELYLGMNLAKMLNEWDYLSNKTLDRNKCVFEIRLYLLKDLSEFNFLHVKIGTILELSFKGIALNKKYNIFQMRSSKLIKYSELDLENLRTYELSFFINNLDKLLSKKQIKKYDPMFRYFMKKRNEFVHFAKKQHKIDYNEILVNFKLLDDYFMNVVMPIKEKVSKKQNKLDEKAGN